MALPAANKQKTIIKNQKIIVVGAVFVSLRLFLIIQTSIRKSTADIKFSPLIR
jgi:hypothetical protein